MEAARAWSAAPAQNVGAGIKRQEERDENARHRRSSDPRWPRVMRRRPRGRRRSVDRNTCRPAIEPRNHSFGVPTSSHETEGHIADGVTASRSVDLARSENLCMYGVLLRENREVPLLAQPDDHWSGCSGKAEVVRLRARGWEVRRSRSTCEAVAGYVIAQLRRKRFVVRFTNVEVLASVAPTRPAGAGHGIEHAQRPANARAPSRAGSLSSPPTVQPVESSPCRRHGTHRQDKPGSQHTAARNLWACQSHLGASRNSDRVRRLRPVGNPARRHELNASRTKRCNSATGSGDHAWRVVAGWVFP
jgi:hypothetical protein